MGSRIKVFSQYKGIDLCNSANTHPFSKTKCIIVFKEDLGLKTGTKRFRYECGNLDSINKAIQEAKYFIDKYKP